MYGSSRQTDTSSQNFNAYLDPNGIGFTAYPNPAQARTEASHRRYLHWS
jgi:hypothetical protein